MFTFIDTRNSGKTKKLLQTAREQKAAIVTQDKRAFEVKAKSYHYEDIEILDYNDLEENCFFIDKPLLIHNGDKMLEHLMSLYYGVKTIGFSATMEDKKNGNNKAR